MQADVTLRVQLLGLAAPEELEIVDGNMLVRMLDGEPIVCLLLLLTGTKIWLRERTTPAEFRLGTGQRQMLGALLDGLVVVSWATLLFSCQWRQITGNRHGANNGKTKTTTNRVWRKGMLDLLMCLSDLYGKTVHCKFKVRCFTFFNDYTVQNPLFDQCCLFSETLSVCLLNMYLHNTTKTDRCL